MPRASKAVILRDWLQDLLEQAAEQQWPPAFDPRLETLEEWHKKWDHEPRGFVDELDIIRPCRRGRGAGIRVTLADGRELTVIVEQTEPPRAVKA